MPLSRLAARTQGRGHFSGEPRQFLNWLAGGGRRELAKIQSQMPRDQIAELGFESEEANQRARRFFTCSGGTADKAQGGLTCDDQAP